MADLVKLKKDGDEALVERGSSAFESYLSQGYKEDTENPAEKTEGTEFRSYAERPTGPAPDVVEPANNAINVLSGDPVTGASIPAERRGEELLPGSRSPGQSDPDASAAAMRSDPNVPLTGDHERDAAVQAVQVKAEEPLESPGGGVTEPGGAGGHVRTKVRNANDASGKKEADKTKNDVDSN